MTPDLQTRLNQLVYQQFDRNGFTTPYLSTEEPFVRTPAMRTGLFGQDCSRTAAPIIFSLKKIVTPAARCVKLFLMTTITRSDELRYANRARVLASLRSYGCQSRKQLSKNTGLSAATVTQVTAALLDEHILVESSTADSGLAETRGTGTAAEPESSKAGSETRQAGTAAISAKPALTSSRTNRRGRPQVVLEMTADAAMVATVTINVDWIEVTVFDYTGTVLQQITSAIKRTKLTGRSLLAQVSGSLQRALDSGHLEPSALKHITVACQGKVSKQDGILLWSPLSQSEIINFGSHLQSQFGVGVSVDNDCNMIARALYRSKLPSDVPATIDSDGEDAASGNFAAVLISYGVGLGLIHEGAILTGSRSSGTELGHMQIAADGPLCRCGNHGCIEAYAADYAIWRRVQGLSTDQFAEATVSRQTMHDIFTAACASDGIERLALREAGTAIGHGLANLFAIFDSFPTRLVGLSDPAAMFVAEAIHKRLQDSVDIGSEDIVSVHDSDTENELIRKGAAMQCLHYVDSQIFSIGSTHSATKSATSN